MPLDLATDRSPRSQNLSRSSFHLIVALPLRAAPVSGSISSPLQDQVPFIFFATAASSAGGSGIFIASEGGGSFTFTSLGPAHGSPPHGSFALGFALPVAHGFFFAAQGLSALAVPTSANVAIA